MGYTARHSNQDSCVKGTAWAENANFPYWYGTMLCMLESSCVEPHMLLTTEGSAFCLWKAGQSDARGTQEEEEC